MGHLNGFSPEHRKRRVSCVRVVSVLITARMSLGCVSVTCVSADVALKQPRTRETLAAVRTLAALRVRPDVHAVRRHADVYLLHRNGRSRDSHKTAVSMSASAAAARKWPLAAKGKVLRPSTLSQCGHFLAFLSVTERCVCRWRARLDDVEYRLPQSGQT